MRSVLKKRRRDWQENESFQREVRKNLLLVHKLDVAQQVTPRDFERLHQVARWRPTYLMEGTMRTNGRVTWSDNSGLFDETWPEYKEASVQYEEDPIKGLQEEAGAVQADEKNSAASPYRPRIIRLNRSQETQCNIIPSTADNSWQINARRKKLRKRVLPLKVDTQMQKTLSRPSKNLQSEHSLMRKVITSNEGGTTTTLLPSPATRNGSITPLSASTMRSNLTMLESCPWSSEVESVNLHSNIHVVIQRYFEQTLAALSPNALAEIDHTILHCIENAIVTLDLQNRKLRQIPVFLMEAQHITHLDLSRNKLSSLPGWFFLALEKNLHHLDLSRNYLFDLPEQFSSLRKLKRLNLSYNKLQFFPPQLLDIHHLVDMNVSHNSIIALPHNIIHMKLTDLDISFNWLMTLPENFASLNKRLKFFRCQDNNFSYITRARVLTKLVSAMSHRKRAISNPHQPSKPVIVPNSNNTTTNASANSHSQKDSRFSLDAAGPRHVDGHARSHSSDFAPEISALRRPILAEKKEKIEFFDEYDGEQTSRVQMMMELLEFEQQYLRHLNILHDLYLVPLTQHRSDIVQRFDMSDSLVTIDRLSVILPVELHSVITFSRSFIIQLKEMMGNYESSPLVLRDITNIGALFIEQKDFLLTFYAPYIKVYDKSIHMLSELRDQCAGFNKFVRSRVALPLSGGMDLASLLVLPLTRIPIYTSFIRRILRATSTDHVDHFQLKSAVVLMNECLNKQHHEIFLLDNSYKIKDIQKKLKVKKNLSVSGRVLVREGKLSLAPTRQIHQFRKEIGKYITGKKSYGDYKKIQLNPYIEAAKSKIKDKSAGDMMNDLWGIRLAELYVYVYLFNDILIVKETNMFQKLVGRVQKFDLLGSVVSPYEHKDRALCVELKNRHKLVFIAETQSQFILWLKDFENVSTELNLRYEERRDLVDSLPIDSDEEADLSIAENAEDLSDSDEVFVDLYD